MRRKKCDKTLRQLVCFFYLFQIGKPKKKLIFHNAMYYVYLLSISLSLYNKIKLIFSSFPFPLQSKKRNQKIRSNVYLKKKIKTEIHKNSLPRRLLPKSKAYNFLFSFYFVLYLFCIPYIFDFFCRVLRFNVFYLFSDFYYARACLT